LPRLSWLWRRRRVELPRQPGAEQRSSGREADGPRKHARADVVAREQTRGRVDAVYQGGCFEPAAHRFATVQGDEQPEPESERVRELTDGQGAHSVLECVGLDDATLTAIRVARPGGAVGRVGVPQSEKMPGSQLAFYGNVKVGGGPAPARAYIEELLLDVLDSKIEPGRVFDRSVPLDETPEGYRAMDQRGALEVMIEP
jgi:Zn-dependent alcohol dehydrogenase